MEGLQTCSTLARMEQSQKTILTPFNYYEWKKKVVILIWCKGFYKITMEIEVDPNSTIEKKIGLVEWIKPLEYLSISIDLLFHVKSTRTITPNEV